MKGKAIIPLVLGLGIGLVAVKFVVDTLKKARASGAATQKITAVRAKLDIGAYAEIKPDMVELIETTDNLFAPSQDRINKLEEAIGRVTSKAIPQRSPVLQSMLTPPGTASGMEGRIRPGFRAVSVKIDEVTGVAYQIQPGDLVDVIVVMDIESGDRRRTKETFAEVILQRVEVAAIGQSTATGTPEETGSKVKPAKSATLLVTAEDAIKLHVAATRGKITLSLRGKDDIIMGNFEPASSQEMLRMLRGKGGEHEVTAPQPVAWSPSAPPPTAVAQAQEPHGVTVYRRTSAGNQLKVDIERITFEGPKSSKIIEVGDRPNSRANALMRSGSRSSSSGAAPPTSGSATRANAQVETPPASQPVDEDDSE